MSEQSTTPGKMARILTGDTPTGRLHLGHYVGSIENRLKVQEEYECYFLLANMHAFTTRAEKFKEIREDTIEIVAGLNTREKLISVDKIDPLLVEDRLMPGTQE